MGSLSFETINLTPYYHISNRFKYSESEKFNSSLQTNQYECHFFQVMAIALENDISS